MTPLAKGGTEAIKLLLKQEIEGKMGSEGAKSNNELPII
jgi:hypothetical protein